MSNLTKEQSAKILGISVNSTNKEAKKAYKKLSLKHHPDRGGDKENFNLIQKAYFLLKGKGTSKPKPKVSSVSQHKGVDIYKKVQSYA